MSRRLPTPSALLHLIGYSILILGAGVVRANRARNLLTSPWPPPPRGSTPPPGVTLPTGEPYEIGALSGMHHVWVDPQHGSDARTGASPATALRTLSAAWGRIPQATVLSAGYHVHIAPGTLSSAAMPNYWESRWGTRAAPIILEAAQGRGSVTLAGMNVFDVRHLYLIGLTLASEFEPFHCERCTNLLLRNVTARGICPQGYTTNCGVQEAIKMNQCQGVWVENVESYNAWDNSFDCVACQYGHILGGKFHHSEWQVYLKGGSAYFLVTGVEIYSGGTTGFAAGQGTGFEFMVAPWLQYEAYAIKFYNNVIHDIQGAGMGVWGCYDCLFAYNTLVRVGARSHTIEVKLGSRSCDGNATACSINYSAGGWGPTSPQWGGSDWAVNIPNRNVLIVNNLVFNPPPFNSQWQDIQVDGPTPSNSPPGRLPATVSADSGLVIRGNVVWNGGPSMPLGVGGAGNGCSDANPTCNTAQLLSRNAFNAPDSRPSMNLTTYRLIPGGSSANVTAHLWRPLPAFGAWQAAVPPGPAVPPGTLGNVVPLDRAGASRTAGRDAPGAYDLT